MMGAILVLNVLVVLVFFKELKLSTFDPGLAAALGFSPVALHYAFMTLVSVTAVGAFDAVGSILMVALMIAPPAAAYLFTDRLGVLLPLSGGIGAVSAIAGYWLARSLDASIAGSMATTAGAAFLAALLAAPERGIVAGIRRRSRQRVDFAGLLLTIHLLHHEEGPRAEVENRVPHLQEHLRWSPEFARRVVRRAEREGLLTREAGERLYLTPLGREAARHRMVT
jgi:manganese/zinc/iron transport system permease protein